MALEIDEDVDIVPADDIGRLRVAFTVQGNDLPPCRAFGVRSCVMLRRIAKQRHVETAFVMGLQHALQKTHRRMSAPEIAGEITKADPLAPRMLPHPPQPAMAGRGDRQAGIVRRQPVEPLIATVQKVRIGRFARKERQVATRRSNGICLLKRLDRRKIAEIARHRHELELRIGIIGKERRKLAKHRQRQRVALAAA